MKIEEIEKHGKKAKGKKELEKHLNGRRLTERQAILGQCYYCRAYYSDGKLDCETPDCPLYPFMPYRKGEKLVMRRMTMEQKKKIGLNLPQKKAA